jgi:hypothetical protein
MIPGAVGLRPPRLCHPHFRCGQTLQKKSPILLAVASSAACPCGCPASSTWDCSTGPCTTGQGSDDYRELVLKLTMIAIMLTLSINLINGYRENSHAPIRDSWPSVPMSPPSITLLFLPMTACSASPLLPTAIGPWFFPLALILGGFVRSRRLHFIVAIPSFRTRGDYLAIISLAFMFIVKSLHRKHSVARRAPGHGKPAKLVPLPVVFVWTMLCIWVINNFVRSIFGKALNAVRDDEIAAECHDGQHPQDQDDRLSVRRFLGRCMAGGLFAHVMTIYQPRHVRHPAPGRNPGDGLLWRAELCRGFHRGGVSASILISEMPCGLWKFTSGS